MVTVIFMKVSTRGRYGLRAVADIAARAKEGAAVVSTRSIAARQGISENYLEQIIALLKERGLVKSVRGAGGGYILAREPGDITAGEVLRALEGTLSPAECLDELKNKEKTPGSCADCENCAARGVLSKIYESVTEVVDSITILDIINDISGNSIDGTE